MSPRTRHAPHEPPSRGQRRRPPGLDLWAGTSGRQRSRRVRRVANPPPSVDSAPQAAALRQGRHRIRKHVLGEPWGPKLKTAAVS